MLILPIHRRFELREIPWVTLLIALICTVVFLGPQQGDPKKAEQAFALYESADLASIESPLYELYAESNPDALSHQFEAADLRWTPIDAMIWDRAFRAWLASGQAFDSPENEADWRRRSEPFQTMFDSTVHERFAMTATEPSVVRSITSAFLHGDLDHLLGNMVFLLALGLLVERALGASLFALLYAMAASAGAWFWWLFALPTDNVVGASGAIAGLSGALCVLWGFKKIRFFYWFIVIFDYVRAPAIWLLVPWLGWEVFQWLTEEGSQVAYGAHIGGMAAGAALAGLLKAFGCDRKEAYEETVAKTVGSDADLDAAKAALGRLAFDDVEARLAPLLASGCASVEAKTLSLRAAVMAKRTTAAADRAVDLLRSISGAPNTKALDALEAWRAGGGQLSPENALRYGRALVASGRAGLAASVLSEAVAAGPVPDHWAGAWLAMAFESRRVGDEAGALSLFKALADALPGTPEAAKARDQLRD